MNNAGAGLDPAPVPIRRDVRMQEAKKVLILL